MRRRKLIAFLGSAALLPVAGRAQLHTKPAVIGWLGVGNQAAGSRYQDYLREGLREQGDVEGQTFIIAPRYAEFRVDRLRAIAEEVVKLNPTLIVGGGTDAVVAAKKATSTIPIVTAALADAEHLGLVQSYSRPGGNVTGITPYVAGLPAKQMEIAREVAPEAKKIGLLGNMNDPKAPPQRDELEEMARKFGIKIILPEVRGPEDLANAVATLASEQAGVVIVLQTTIMLNLRREIASLLEARRLRLSTDIESTWKKAV
jgi:putative tryptophan/tyrosine transport system substrate-binding protein